MMVLPQTLLAVCLMATSSVHAFGTISTIIPKDITPSRPTTTTTTKRRIFCSYRVVGDTPPVSSIMKSSFRDDETATPNIDTTGKNNYNGNNKASTATPLFMEPDNASTTMDVAGTPRGFMNNLQDFDLDGLVSAQQQKLQKSIATFNADSILTNVGKTRENFMAGEIGQRGEVYVLAQAALVIGIICGGIPYLGDFLNFVCGPGLFTLGFGIIALGLRDIGPSLNVWTAPTPNTKIVTSGIFNEIRHPIYTGLLCTMLGLSITTGSASRLILSGLLWFVLDAKSDYEEEQLVDKFGDTYVDYMKKVPGKFFPAELAHNLRLFW